MHKLIPEPSKRPLRTFCTFQSGREAVAIATSALVRLLAMTNRRPPRMIGWVVASFSCYYERSEAISEHQEITTFFASGPEIATPRSWL